MLPERRPYYFRRGAAVAICLAPIACAIGSFFAPQRRVPLWATILVLIAAAIGLLNFHLSFGRPLLYKWRHGSLEGYRFVSGIPLLGSVIILFVVLSTFGAHPVAAAALAILAIDTGGLPWFVIATWREHALGNRVV